MVKSKMTVTTNLRSYCFPVVLMCFDFFCAFQINCVVMRGINDDEVCDFVRVTEEKVTNYAFFILC